MAKTQKILGLVLFFLLIVGIAPVNSEEGTKDKLFLKSGRIVECDKAWIASDDIVRCKKGSGEILYSTDEVDIKKTFGEIEAKRFEEERKAWEEKELLRPVAKVSGRSESYITIGIGKLSGDTTYQIGGNYVTPLGSGQVHFPISELEFPLDVWMVSVEGSKEFAEKWKVSVGVKKNITSDAGKMKDSDWLTLSNPGQLDVYSESDAKLDALIMDISLHYRFYEKSNWSLIAGLGYIRQNFDYGCKLIRQWSPSGLAGYDYTGTGAVGITYKVIYNIPYIEIGVQGSFKDDFSVEASLGYSSIVDAEDEDVHILRAMVSEADCDGDAILLSLKGRFYLSKNWLVMAEFDYTKIEVDGTSMSYIGGVYTHTIDQEIKSEQIFAGFSVGYAF